MKGIRIPVLALLIAIRKVSLLWIRKDIPIS